MVGFGFGFESQDKVHLANLAVDAVLRRKGSENALHAIHIIKKCGGALKDSVLEEGFILDAKIGVGQPKRIENASILVADTDGHKGGFPDHQGVRREIEEIVSGRGAPLGCRLTLGKKTGVAGQPKCIENAKILASNTAVDTEKVKTYVARVREDAMSKVAESIEAAEKITRKNKVDMIVGHGVNCFVNKQLINNYPEELFADAGVMAIEQADHFGTKWFFFNGCLVGGCYLDSGKECAGW